MNLQCLGYGLSHKRKKEKKMKRKEKRKKSGGRVGTGILSKEKVTPYYVPDAILRPMLMQVWVILPKISAAR